MKTRPTLFDEHLLIESLCVDLVARAEAGEWQLADAIWDEFARRLHRHMDLEETELFPRFLRRFPESRDAIRRLQAEHDGFRADLERLGIRLQLHELRCDDAREFVARIRRHADAENLEFYPWMESTESDGACDREPLPATVR